VLVLYRQPEAAGRMSTWMRRWGLQPEPVPAPADPEAFRLPVGGLPKAVLGLSLPGEEGWARQIALLHSGAIPFRPLPVDASPQMLQEVLMELLGI
jgi:hypothetical protein